MVRNLAGLKLNARSRSDETMLRATLAIRQMKSEEVEINFRSVAVRAGVSTAWLYRTKPLRDKIMKARTTSPAVAGETPQYRQRLSHERIFGGLREAVLERDGYRCRVCDASGRDKRSIIVHHRVPGKSVLNLMLSLCPACHAKVHRTKAALSAVPPLLLELWREQHPKGHEQVQLDFTYKKPVAKLQSLSHCFVRRARRVLSPGTARRDAHEASTETDKLPAPFWADFVIWGEIIELPTGG